MFARKSLVDKAVHRRFAVTLADNQGIFSGILTEFDENLWVFEDCATMPGATDATPEPIAGRVFIDRINVSYLQELPA